MIELIDPHNPIWIPGQPIPKANIELDYRVRNIPALSIRNPRLQRKKMRYDLAMVQKDMIALIIKKYAAEKRFMVDPSHTNVFISARLVFHSKTQTDPAKLKIDLDNCEKLFYDGIQASGLVKNDCQITGKLILKCVTSGQPGFGIHSIAFANSIQEVGRWAMGVIGRIPDVYMQKTGSAP